MANNGRPGYAYSYSYEGQQELDHYSSSAREGEESFILKFHCPSLSSLRWMVKLYSLVLGGLGVILSFTWICFHLYVLSVTSLPELRQQRYLDITLGVVLLLSMLCLLYGSYSQSSHFLILFFILSLVVVICYWSWYVYINFVSHDSAVFEDQVGKIGLMLTVLYGLMMVPIMLLYRYLELQTNLEVNTVPRLEERMENVSVRKYPPRYDESFEFH